MNSRSHVFYRLMVAIILVFSFVCVSQNLSTYTRDRHAVAAVVIAAAVAVAAAAAAAPSSPRRHHRRCAPSSPAAAAAARRARSVSRFYAYTL